MKKNDLANALSLAQIIWEDVETLWSYTDAAFKSIEGASEDTVKANTALTVAAGIRVLSSFLSIAEKRTAAIAEVVYRKEE